MEAQPLNFVVPVSLWTKSSAAGGQKRRIGGPVSTEARDLQKERVFQLGLDFAPFLESGVFTDEHDKSTHNMLGEPTGVEPFRKGQRLPDDTIAEWPLSWVEGFLFEDYEPADRLWQLAQSLQKSGSTRRLGFSVEGSVLGRDPMQPLDVVKGVVRDVAITRKPMNMTTRLEVLAKSLSAAMHGGVLIPESLEDAEARSPTVLSERARRRRELGLTKSEAAAYILSKYPKATPAQVAQIWLHAQGKTKP